MKKMIAGIALVAVVLVFGGAFVLRNISGEDSDSSSNAVAVQISEENTPLAVVEEKISFGAFADDTRAILEEKRAKVLSKENHNEEVTSADVKETGSEENSDENSEDASETDGQSVQTKNITICIDPGHGGEGETAHGVEACWDGNTVMEKNLNLAIAIRLKGYLEAAGINVVMTRTGDTAMDLGARVNVAVNAGADFFISIHNNSSSTGNAEDSGCLAIVTGSSYNGCYDKSHAVASSVLGQLQGIGIPLTSDWGANANGGLLIRGSEKGATYPDGSTKDYYGIVARCTEAGIPSCIIEHAFVPNYSDYENFLSSDEKLDALARADAAGILAAIQ